MSSSSSSISKASFVSALLIALTSVAHAGDLTVEVKGLKSATGEVAVGLFDQNAEFPKQYTYGVRLVATKDGVLAVFKDVKPGVYAISAYHDENDNKKLDRGMFGIPKEAYGFSQDARGEGGPPQFRDAQFEVPADGTRVQIKLR
jgi:uncharacterized protein (DUF2141 family)